MVLIPLAFFPLSSAVTNRWLSLGLDLRLTIDKPASNWKSHVGLVTQLVDDVQLDQNSMGLVCGPGIMIRFALKKLTARGIFPGNIITTLERHMKCGTGMCGHCHSNGKLVCIDGPVFTADQLPEPENP